MIASLALAVHGTRQKRNASLCHLQFVLYMITDHSAQVYFAKRSRVVLLLRLRFPFKLLNTFGSNFIRVWPYPEKKCGNHNRLSWKLTFPDEPLPTSDPGDGTIADAALAEHNFATEIFCIDTSGEEHRLLGTECIDSAWPLAGDMTEQRAELKTVNSGQWLGMIHVLGETVPRRLWAAE